MRRWILHRLLLAAALLAPGAASLTAAGEIVVLKNDGSEANDIEVLKLYNPITGGWTIALRELYAPGGLTLYEIRGNGGETIDLVAINVPCWKAPSGQCMPAGSPVFVRVINDPPLGIKSVHMIDQSGTAETFLTHVYVNDDIGMVNVETIGILEAGRDILGPVIATTTGNPLRGISQATAHRHILGDLIAMQGKVENVKAGGSVGTPDDPIDIHFKYNTLNLEAEEVHADIRTRVNVGSGHLWRLTADRFFGSIDTPKLGASAAGEPALLRVNETLAGQIHIGTSFSDPAHRIELPPGGFSGQIVINADNAGGDWQAPIHLGPEDHPDHAVLLGPLYEPASEALGGGAVGLVPFRLHHASCDPPSGSTVFVAPGDEPIVELEHYGPVHVQAGEPIKVERRPAGDAGAFAPLPLTGFSVELVGSDAKILRIGSAAGGGFEAGHEYRITPTAALRSLAKDHPAVLWHSPYTVTVLAESGGGPDDPEPPVCSGDLNGDGMVDVFDLLVLLGSWGGCSGACAADLTGDGVVDVIDLLMLLANWGPCAEGASR